MDVKARPHRKLSAEELLLLNCGAGEDSWESLVLQGDPASQSKRKSVLNIHWKDWCWSWNSSTLATWYEELTHWKRPYCWERLKVGGEGDDREWDGWMAVSLSRLCELVMDRKAWHAVVQGVAKSWKWLRDWTDPLTEWSREALGLVWVFSTSRGIYPELILVTHGRQN